MGEIGLLDAASANKSRMVGTFVRIALYTAMRHGEILSLRWSQIDFTADDYRGQSKTESGTGRQIPLNDKLAAILQMHRVWYVEKLGKWEPDWYLFPFSRGVKPVDPTRWEAVREKAQVSCRFHDLRHTTLTKWAEAGVPEGTMLALAGHMCRSMLERYSHIRMKAKKDAVMGLTIVIRKNGIRKNVVPKEIPIVEPSEENGHALTN
jgi:integrase